MPPPALRTRLLSLFAHLAAANSSFAEGDLVMDDADATIFDDLCGLGMRMSRGWWEITLSEPLTFLCPCATCSARGEYKSALRFRRHGDYIVLRLLKDPWYTVEGGMELARLTLWGEPRTGEGCAGGWRSIDAPSYLPESILLDEALHRNSQSIDSLKHYNRKFRLGNELYAPLRLWNTDAVKTSK